jgi:epoxyqueuosine reductase
MVDLVSQIKYQANEIGFKLFGITSPSSLENFIIFENWLSRKCYGDMHYLDTPSSRDFRKNPKHLLPECKSIISVGLPYVETEPSTNNPGEIALFALQPDYHQVIQHKLASLLQFIISITNENTKGVIYCDSSPVLEKELAKRAGLGQIGKNSLLISPVWGSLFNLGELFINIEIPSSAPLEIDLCVDCQLCIQSCPTGCIGNDRTLTADHCISYLTIEHKGVIPRDLRPLMDSWIYGCDICQLVCPWNQKHFQAQNKSHEKSDIPPEKFPGFINLGLLENEKTQIPLKRSVRKKILRNYAISIGNSHDENAIHLLEEMFQEKEPETRASVAWALGKIKTERTRKILRAQRQVENEPLVIEEIKLSLECFN